MLIYELVCECLKKLRINFFKAPANCFFEALVCEFEAFALLMLF